MWKLGLRHWIAGLTLCAAAISFPAGASSLTSPPDSPFIVESWDTEDGLPQGSVIAALQTRDAYLWLGTLNGLVRFDGVRFEVFDANTTPGLNSGRIVHLFEDSRTNLWIGTETAGVALAQRGTVRVLEKLSGGSREGRLVSACEDSTGAVWLYMADGRLYRCLAGAVDSYDLRGGPSDVSRTLVAEPDRLWVGPQWLDGELNKGWWLLGIGLLDQARPPDLAGALRLPMASSLDYLVPSPKGGHWRLANGRILKCRGNTLERDPLPYPWKANARPSAACEDADGNLIVGTLDETSGDGVFWHDSAGRPRRLSRTEGLSADGILSLCLDREGNLWVGTDGGGLNRVKRKPFRLAVTTKGPVAQTVCGDGAGGVWMGFTRGAAFLQGEVVREFGPAEGLTSRFEQNVTSVFVDREKQVWVGTGSGLFQLKGTRLERVPGPGAIQTAVTVIHQDRQGRLWFGTQAGIVRRAGEAWDRFTTLQGLTSDNVRAIADDAAGNLWIGTTGGGLNRLRDGQLSAFRKQDGALPSDDITSLLPDEDGALWIGTPGGLVRFAGGQWTRYTTEDGLVSNGIGYLLEDGEGDLWLGSNAGLMRVKKTALNDFAADRIQRIPCRAYEKADGLPTRECKTGSQPAACRTADGQLWFPTTLGLVHLNPADLKPNQVPPPVVIESVWVEDHRETSGALRAAQPVAITIPPRKGQIELHYTSLNLAAPTRTRFRYRMGDYETKWTPAGDRRVATYPKLPPGRFTFEVEACNEDGVWSANPATLAITVQPPFWLTWWFMTASALALLGAVAGAVHLVSTQKLKRRLRQQEALEKERSRIARDLHDQLGANLTQVSLLGELVEADRDLPGEVEAHAQQIVQTSRETTRALDEIVWATNPANDTLEGLINYVCKYAQEYLALAGLRYRLEVPSPLPATPLLPEVRHNVFLAAKEAVNNVVKHAHASSVWVRLHLDATQFVLEIQDDGHGLPDAGRSSTRNGLKNMRKRLEDAGGRFEITHAPERGTIVRLTVPLRISDFGFRISN
jgi:signal transduction histidine kinase/ligand-binding sensor domain-containing protein